MNRRRTAFPPDTFGEPGIFGAPFGEPIAGGVAYLLDDKFITAVAAPMTSPRNAEPGPGRMVKNADTNNNVAITSDVFQISGVAASNFTDPMYYWDINGNGIARASGRVLIARNVIDSVSINRGVTFGWSASTGGTGNVNAGGIYLSSGGGLAAVPGTALTLGDVWAISATYQLAIVLFSTGSAMFMKGGVFTNWTLLFVEHSFTNTPLFPKITGVSNMNFNFDEVLVSDILTGAFASDYGIANIRDTTLLSGDTFVGTADGVHSFEFTLNGSPSANDEISLDFRRQDANNTQRAIVKRNAGNTAWDFQVRTVTGGTPATPSGWTDVTGVGTPGEICVVADGQTLAFFTRASTTWTKRGATLTNSSFQTAPGLAIQAAAGTTLTAVNSYPRTSSNYDVLDSI